MGGLCGYSPGSDTEKICSRPEEREGGNPSTAGEDCRECRGGGLGHRPVDRSDHSHSRRRNVPSPVTVRIDQSSSRSRLGVAFAPTRGSYNIGALRAYLAQATNSKRNSRFLRLKLASVGHYSSACTRSFLDFYRESPATSLSLSWIDVKSESIDTRCDQPTESISETSLE